MVKREKILITINIITITICIITMIIMFIK